ncbi:MULTISPECIES: AzlC family ABC transporter permease [unclassified Actinotignum]|uniref:AzlC family ABC transporter permease n=1 Tax=unclassified Actinotignum TaxID=2632702 RepID=UPI003F47F7FC
MPSHVSDVRFGAQMAAGAGLGMIPLGMAFGLLVIQYGQPWWLAPALSFFIYSGSAELLAVALISAHAPVLTILLTIFFVNVRHVFYAFSYPIAQLTHPLARMYCVYSLTDETYAITTSHPGVWNQRRLISLQAVLQVCWVGGGLLGVAIGGFLPGQIRGVNFALVALFIVLALDAFHARRDIPGVLGAGLAFVLAQLCAPSALLPVAMSLFALFLVVRFVVRTRFRKNDDAAPSPRGASGEEGELS